MSAIVHLLVCGYNSGRKTQEVIHSIKVFLFAAV